MSENNGNFPRHRPKYKSVPGQNFNVAVIIGPTDCKYRRGKITYLINRAFLPNHRPSNHDDPFEAPSIDLSKYHHNAIDLFLKSLHSTNDSLEELLSYHAIDRHHMLRLFVDLWQITNLLFLPDLQNHLADTLNDPVEDHENWEDATVRAADIHTLYRRSRCAPITMQRFFLYLFVLKHGPQVWSCGLQITKSRFGLGNALQMSGRRDDLFPAGRWNYAKFCEFFHVHRNGVQCVAVAAGEESGVIQLNDGQLAEEGGSLKRKRAIEDVGSDGRQVTLVKR